MESIHNRVSLLHGICLATGELCCAVLWCQKATRWRSAESLWKALPWQTSAEASRGYMLNAAVTPEYPQAKKVTEITCQHIKVLELHANQALNVRKAPLTVDLHQQHPINREPSSQRQRRPLHQPLLKK